MSTRLHSGNKYISSTPSKFRGCSRSGYADVPVARLPRPHRSLGSRVLAKAGVDVGDDPEPQIVRLPDGSVVYSFSGADASEPPSPEEADVPSQPENVSKPPSPPTPPVTQAQSIADGQISPVGTYTTASECEPATADADSPNLPGPEPPPPPLPPDTVPEPGLRRGPLPLALSNLASNSPDSAPTPPSRPPRQVAKRRWGNTASPAPDDPIQRSGDNVEVGDAEVSPAPAPRTTQAQLTVEDSTPPVDIHTDALEREVASAAAPSPDSRADIEEHRKARPDAIPELPPTDRAPAAAQNGPASALHSAENGHPAAAGVSSEAGSLSTGSNEGAARGTDQGGGKSGWLEEDEDWDLDGNLLGQMDTVGRGDSSALQGGLEPRKDGVAREVEVPKHKEQRSHSGDEAGSKGGDVPRNASPSVATVDASGNSSSGDEDKGPGSLDGVALEVDRGYISTDSESDSESSSDSGPLAGIPVPRLSYGILNTRGAYESTPAATLRRVRDQERRWEKQEGTRGWEGVGGGQKVGQKVGPKEKDGTSGSVAHGTWRDAGPRDKHVSGLDFETVMEVRDRFRDHVAHRRLQEALDVIEDCNNKGRSAICALFSHRNFMAAARERRDVAAALRFLHLLPREYANAQTYHHAISVCKTAEDISAVLAIFDLMEARGQQPDALHYSNAIAVCTRKADIERGYQLFGQMAAAGVKPDRVVVGSLMGVCAAAVHALRGELNAGGSHTLDGREQGARRQQLVLVDRAFSLVPVLERYGLRPDVGIWNTLIDCAGNSGQLSRAFQLFDDMTASGCRPDHTTFVTLIHSCNLDKERSLALRTYRQALRTRTANLRVHTAALNTCLLETDLDTGKPDLSNALHIYSTVQTENLELDGCFMETLIAVAGHHGSLRQMFALLDDMRDMHLKPQPTTAAVVVQACLGAGEVDLARETYQGFLEKDKIVPTVRCFNQLINAYSRQGRMEHAAAILEDLVAAGLVPASGTLAALLTGCQRARAHELAFALATAGRARGILIDATLGFILLRVCYNKIRYLWAPQLGYPPPLNETEADARRSGERHTITPRVAERLLHALCGRVGEEVDGDGSDDPRTWRDRAHSIYRDLLAAGARLTPAILERLVACMFVNASAEGRSPPPVRAAAAAAAASPQASNLEAVSRLDGRFDPRAYKYIEDAAAADRLPSTSIAADRIIDLRAVPPATAEAYILELFNKLYLKHGAARRRVAATLTLLTPPFRRTFVNLPSRDESRAGFAAAARASAASPKPAGGASLDDDLEDLSMGYQQLPGEAFETREARILHRLERAFGVDLSLYHRAPSATPDAPAASSVAAATAAGDSPYVGLAVVSALRRLNVTYSKEASVGVVIVEPDDMTSFVARRHTELMERKQRPRATVVHDDDHVMADDPVRSRALKQVMADEDLDLTPALREDARVGGQVGMRGQGGPWSPGGLSDQTSGLRSASWGSKNVSLDDDDS